MPEKIIECSDIHGELHSVPVSKLSFRPSVYGILIEDNQVLLSKQWGEYVFPGGGIDIGETIEEALQREFWEETGLSVEVGEIVTCGSALFMLPLTNQPFHTILLYYVVKRVSGRLSSDNFGDLEIGNVEMAEWIPFEQALAVTSVNSVYSKDILQKAIQMST